MAIVKPTADRNGIPTEPATNYGRSWRSSRVCASTVNDEVALLAGELSAELLGRGERIEVEDVPIVATATHNETAVLTRTTDRFDRMTGSDVESY